MCINASDYIDYTTGKINCTNLAEACAAYFKQDYKNGPLDDETHWIWDLAVEEAIRWESYNKE